MNYKTYQIYKNIRFTKRYLLYLGRWQLSTPVLAIVLKIMNPGYSAMMFETIIANLIGGLIFFWIDRLIFKHKNIN